MIKPMNSRDDFTGPVNVGNPNEFTIIESSKNNRINWLKVKITYQPTVRRSYAKTARYFFSKKELDWSPKVNLNEGLIKYKL
jgi:UDP-glucuronate decarboxylase